MNHEHTQADALLEQLQAGALDMEMDTTEDLTPDQATMDDFLTMFGAQGRTPLKAEDWKAYVPSELTSIAPGTVLYGFIREETESIYLFTHTIQGTPIGYVAPAVHDMGDTFVVVHQGETLKVALHRGDEVVDVRVKQYDGVTNLFSRNSGLLESGEMLDKWVVLVGCGSVGSFAAMELARSGVGGFVLVDTDILEIHNICRHQCGFDDLGRYKVDAVADKIRNINPQAKVVTFRSMLQRVPREELLPYLGRNTLILGGGDNRASADFACTLATETDSAFVASACWSRAFAGEVFYWMSGHGLSCYHCALGGMVDDARPESHATYFGTDEEQSQLAFEPGIAVDIDFVTTIALKVALDLLNRDNPHYTPRVIHYLRQYTWICNTNSTKIGGERAGIFTHPLQITHNLKVQQDANCPHCCP